MKINNEEIKQILIPELLGYYYISESGKVYSNRFNKYKLLKQSCLPSGYKIITVTVKNKSYNYLVHRLVAKYFLKYPKENLTVNHIDGVKNNNHYSNLEWVTILENNRHARKIGLTKGLPHTEETKLKLSEQRKGKNKSGENYNSKKIINISTKEIFNCMKEAAIKAQYNYSHFSEMINNKVKNKTNYRFLNENS